MTDTSLDKKALKRLLDVIGGDPEDFEELKEDFFESAPETIANLHRASEAQDTDGMRIASHSLKGNARDFGMTTLARLCQDLEEQCKSGAAFDGRQLVLQIAKQTAASATELKALEATDLV